MIYPTLKDFHDSKKKAEKLEVKFVHLIIEIEKQLTYKPLINNRKIGLKIFRNSIDEKLVIIRQARKNLNDYMLNKLFGKFTYNSPATQIIWLKLKDKLEEILKTIRKEEYYIEQS